MINENRIGLQSNVWAVAVPSLLIAVADDWRPAPSRTQSARVRESASIAVVAGGSGSHGLPFRSALDRRLSHLSVAGDENPTWASQARPGNRESTCRSRWRAGEVLGLGRVRVGQDDRCPRRSSAYNRRGLRDSRREVARRRDQSLALQQSELRGHGRGATVGLRGHKTRRRQLNPAVSGSGSLKEALTVHNGATEDSDGEIGLEVLERSRLNRRGPAPTVPASNFRRPNTSRCVGDGLRVPFPALLVLDGANDRARRVDAAPRSREVRALWAARTAVAAVYLSHDLAVVSQLVTTLAGFLKKMYAGRIIELGTTSRRNSAIPVHPIPAAWSTRSPHSTGTDMRAGIGGQPPRPASLPAGCAFAPRCAFVLDSLPDRAVPSADDCQLLVLLFHLCVLDHRRPGSAGSAFASSEPHRRRR